MFCCCCGNFNYIDWQNLHIQVKLQKCSSLIYFYSLFCLFSIKLLCAVFWRFETQNNDVLRSSTKLIMNWDAECCEIFICVTKEQFFALSNVSLQCNGYFSLNNFKRLSHSAVATVRWKMCASFEHGETQSCLWWEQRKFSPENRLERAIDGASTRVSELGKWE